MHAIWFLMVAAMMGADVSYESEIQAWRAKREARLRADDGWLTVAGLFWLKQGANTVGTSEQDRVQLPESAPAAVGTIEFVNGQALFKAAPGVPVLVNGKPETVTRLRSDAETKGKPDIVSVGEVSFFVIQRGERTGIRLKDKNSEFRRGFQGLEWYPIKQEWRVVARWVAYPEPRKIEIDSLTGDKQHGFVPGYAEFEAGGKTYKLEPTLEGDELFFVFRDKTAGKTTYGAARFLYAKAEGDKVVLDFNKAYNPPCAFTPFATCPLPSAGNRLPIEIPAGELMYKGGPH
jgi:uncharacterized protein (DUF1684 family)